ncbi:hypothetical protein L228DRAFT_286137 [Xylona heveae TC161]|uniref:Vacuolar ATPase assembly protein VMA22 n=1 Tax=Xylona heveae (strain CBS 132557 / TC161) TaxID=1328760 RepID=A0A164ZMT8_XYLHT|nr:hypothetical protein L228DRAFT_286137 [Xylona heveae TC161]KZF19290.1 hypothetical protein L228DRAFT_286137 [Xylona heveae TC161]
MMTEIVNNQSIPISAGKAFQDGDETARTLDELLIRYLNLLDQYQAVQAELAQQLSSGYLSLAQANSSTQHNIRYGQDYYDARMQALRTVSVKNEAQETSKFKVIKSSEYSGVDVRKSEPEKTRSSLELAGDGNESREEKEKETESRPKTKSNDPLRWFGILVPPALRAAQGHFARAVDASVPEMVNIIREIESLETEIQSVRKAAKTTS